MANPTSNEPRILDLAAVEIHQAAAQPSSSKAMDAASDYSYIDGILPEMQVLATCSGTLKDCSSDPLSNPLSKRTGDCGSKHGASFDEGISAMASKALANLKTYQETVSNKSQNGEFYKPFDTGDGRIRYDDFAKTLSISSSGLGADDSYLLASQLDNKKSGGLDYKTIYQNLEDLIKRTKQSPLVTPLFVSPIKVSVRTCNESTERDHRGREQSSSRYAFNRSLCSDSVHQVLHADHGGHSIIPHRRSRRAHSHDSGMRNRVREQLQELNTIIAHDETLNEHREYFDDSQLSPRKTIGKDVVKSSIVNQVRGSLSVLHHLMRKRDCSNSGHLSFNEFCAAISQAGVLIPKNDLKSFFSEIVSSPFRSSTDKIVLDRSHGDASTLNIDNFIRGCREDLENNRISAQSFSPEVVHDEDERKIMKLLLRKTTRHEDPVSAIFNHINPKHKGWFSPSQVQEGFQSLNVPLNDADYKQLFTNVKKNNEGMINIREFENFLQEKVTHSDQEILRKKKQRLLTNRRYTRTYQSDDIFHNPEQTEYYSSTTKSNRYKELIWKKLQVSLQTKNDSILRAFSTKEKKGSKTATSLKTIPISDLQTSFASEGIHLGDDDVSLLHYHMQKDNRNSVDKDSSRQEETRGGYLQSYLQGSAETSEKSKNSPANVSLDDVCRALDISLSTTIGAGTGVRLSNPREKSEDGGIFASARTSRMPVTMYDAKYDNMPGYTKGTRYFHLPNNSRTSKKQFRNHPQAHTWEPSKFWLLLHSRPDTLLPHHIGRCHNEPISVVDTRRQGASVAQGVEGKCGNDTRNLKYFSISGEPVQSSSSYSENYTSQKRGIAAAAQSRGQAPTMKRLVAPPSPPSIRTLKKQYSQNNSSSARNFY